MYMYVSSSLCAFKVVMSLSTVPQLLCVHTRPLLDTPLPSIHITHMTPLYTCTCSEMIFQLDRTDKLSVLAKSDLTFLNIYDVGMNKAVFEIVPILHTCTSHYCDRIIQINALNLALYGTDDVLCE